MVLIEVGNSEIKLSMNKDSIMEWDLALDLLHGYLLQYSEVEKTTDFSTAHSTFL